MLADVIEGCRCGAEATMLVRGTGWLPAAIAQDAARREAAPPTATDERESHEAAPGPSIPLPRPPAPPAPLLPPTVGMGQGPDLRKAAPPDRPAAPPFVPAQPVPGDAPVRIAVGAAAAVAVMIAGVFVVPPLIDGDGDGGGTGNTGAGRGDGSTPNRSKVPLVISAPRVPPASHLVDDICGDGFATYIDLENLSVKVDRRDVADSAVSPPVTLKYLACHSDSGGDSNDSLTAELRFLDTGAVAGPVAKPDATVEECRSAARVASLPSTLPLAALDSNLVAPHMGFRVETSRKTVVLVWVTEIREPSSVGGLRTFSVNATQWKAGSETGS